MNEQRGAITLLPQKRSMIPAVERLWKNSSDMWRSLRVLNLGCVRVTMKLFHEQRKLK